MRKILVLFLMLGVANIASAVGITVAWDGGGGTDNSYTNALNWDNTNHLPTLIDNVSIYKPVNGTTTNAVTINTQDAVGLTVRVGGDAWNTAPVGAKPASLYIVPGGKLTTAEVFMVGPESTSVRSGKLYMSGGNVVTGSVNPNNAHFYVGYGFGTIPAGQYVEGDAYISGGQLDIAGNFSIAHNANTIGIVELSGNAIINANGFTMKALVGAGTATASLDIRDSAKVVINGDKRSIIDGYIDNGWIKTNGVAWDDYSHVFYDAGTNKTTMTLVPEPATMCLLGLGAIGLIRRKK